jgi:hypothetical protein
MVLLKPCPDCGGNSGLIEMHTIYKDAVYATYWYSAVCSKCGWLAATRLTPEDAEAFWNDPVIRTKAMLRSTKRKIEYVD